MGYAFFFDVYIILTNFTIMNLFVGVIVDHIQHVANTTDLELMREVRAKQQLLYKELHDLFKVADANGDGSLTTQEFKVILESDHEVGGDAGAVARVQGHSGEVLTR